MRRRLMIAALMASTALTVPTRAAAEPFSAFIAGINAVLSGSLGALATGVFTYSGLSAAAFNIGAGLAAFGGTFLGRALLSLGASALIASLQPRPEVPKPSASFSTFSQPVTYMQRGYGTVKKGGPMGFRSGIVSKKKHYTVTIASHPTEGPVAHFLDLEEVTVDGAGLVTTAPFNGLYASIRSYTGGPSQVADPQLVAAFTGFTSAHDFAGHSYVAMWANQISPKDALKVFKQGREPHPVPVWKMWNEIYDPRDESTGWSDNWALCFAHELVNVWGLSVDWDRVAEEADICDQTVTNRDGGTQARWTFNHVLTDDQDFESVRTQFIAAANGFLWQRTDGKVDFYAGRWIAPTLTLTADDFLSLSVTDGDQGLSPPTEYIGQYREPANGYRETPSAAWVVDPDAPRNAKTLEVYGVGSHNQMLRVLKPLAASEQSGLKLSGTIGLAGFEVIAGGAGGRAHRFVTVDHPLLAEATTFEVSKLELNGDGTTFMLELSKSEAADHAFDAAEEEPQPPDYNNADVAGSDPIDDITGLAGTAVSGTGGVAQILWTWTAAHESLLPVLRLRKSGDDWTEITLGSEADEYTQTGLIDGATYEAQIRAQTAGFRVGDWKPDTPVSVVAVANSDAPDDLAAFSTSVAGSDVTVDFTAPNDPNYWATRIYRADYAASYSGPYDIGDATLVRLEYGPANAVDSWDDTGLSTGHYAYWAAPINASGVEGTASGPETEDVA